MSQQHLHRSLLLSLWTRGPIDLWGTVTTQSHTQTRTQSVNTDLVAEVMVVQAVRTVAAQWVVGFPAH